VHVRDGRFDAIREYIKSSSIPASLLVYIPVRVLPYASNKKLVRS
jgi:hypothetical protein